MVTYTGGEIRNKYIDFYSILEDISNLGFLPPWSKTPSLRLREEYGSRGLVPPFLTDRKMKMLIEADKLIIEPFLLDQIQGATLELRAGHTIYESEYSLSNVEQVERYAKNLSLDREYILEPGKNYYIESFEKIRLLNKWEGLTHTKSTCGRVGLVCQALGEKYAHIKGGGEPEHIMMHAQPLAFPILIRPTRTRLFQIKISDVGNNYLTPDEIKNIYEEDISFLRDGKLLPMRDVQEKNGLKLTLNTKKAFVQKKGVEFEPIDLTKKEYYDPHDYFEFVEYNKNGELLIKTETLNLCGTRERVEMGNVIGVLNREDRHTGLGVLTQLAGFVAPYFCGELTLEMWSSVHDRIVPHGYPAGKLFLEELSGEVENKYGSKTSHYQNQESPRLAKVFKSWD